MANSTRASLRPSSSRYKAGVDQPLNEECGLVLVKLILLLNFTEVPLPHRATVEELMQPVLATLIYCIKEGHVLLLKRKKAPSVGMWVAPGGKVQNGKSPFECAVRELREETGLCAEEVYFRGLVTEVSPQADWQWMLFLFVATSFSGEVVSDEREGVLRWWALSEEQVRHMPEVGQVFFPQMCDLSRAPYHARFVYDETLHLSKVIEHLVVCCDGASCEERYRGGNL